MSEKQAVVSMSPEQLQAIITAAVTAAVQEARKPLPLTPEEEAIKRQDEERRKERGEMELAIKENRKQERLRCSHRHNNGQASVAEVPNVNGVICLHCQAIIKPAPGQFDEGAEDRYIYNEQLYWSLLSSRISTTF